jgi:hypothetical protein
MVKSVMLKQIGIALVAALFVFAVSGLGASATPPPDRPVSSERYATFTVHIENNDDTAHTISFVISHQSSPVCRDTWPVCPASPSFSETIVTKKYRIAAGEQMTISDIRFSVPLTAFYTDIYTVELRTGDGDAASLVGIATTDTSWINEKHDKYEFHVANGETVEFYGKIGKEGVVTLTVEPQPILHRN